ncbi:cysteine synthase A, partial [Capsaspora owczarzaki ATCC 30864]|uniref:Cysteine synthase A n=1 Tax=Capsaspora owczarzaki (strain ATCC 30864) TaxID=595528 RepID=A0A0D2WIK8_CAPO3
MASSAPLEMQGILAAVGETPLVRLHTLSELTGREIYGKAEHLNPAGSVKDRAAKFLVLDAFKRGLLVPGDTIVEGTGGNTGIALAMVASALGLRTLITVPDNVAKEKRDMMERYGAEILVVPQVPFSNPEHFYHAAKRERDRMNADADKAMSTLPQGSPRPPRAYFPDQFENLANREAHRATTGPEIWRQTSGKVNAFVCASGTGGTISGVSSYLKEQDSRVRIVLADCHGSGLASFVQTGELVSDGLKTVTEGIGSMRLTANFKSAAIDECVRVSDAEAVAMGYFLLQFEGIFIGPSASLNAAAAVKVARTLPAGSTIVTIMCDSGERYTSKTFNKGFLQEQQLQPAFDANGRLPRNLDFVL